MEERIHSSIQNLQIVYYVPETILVTRAKAMNQTIAYKFIIYILLIALWFIGMNSENKPVKLKVCKIAHKYYREKFSREEKKAVLQNWGVAPEEVRIGLTELINFE